MGNLKSKLKRSKSKSKKSTNLPDSTSTKKAVDPRLPFSNYRQIFNIRNGWKSVSRVMEDTAKETLIRLLEKHPQYKEKYPMIAGLNTEEEMRESLEFETYAMQIFGMFDEVIQNLENVDAALDEIEHTGKQLTPQLVTDLEDCFMNSLHLVLDERYTETLQENYRLLYGFIKSNIPQDT
ncbi:uncharacterized protein LOC133182022 [Saccostrea echinata]|uniref:uncharacterized protein LOC133182022 n=1 Tax=Saccostrea echinata TaxID=191078 RepID=UPI002A819903|nr:uncharacterized protein LOC133182022 [Saccostrea echinata]